MQDERDKQMATAGAGGACAILFEANPLAADDIESIVEQTAHARIPFLGIVSTAGQATSLPIDRLLRVLDAPVHFFPVHMFDRLLEILSAGDHGNILVLGRGRDPRADLLEHLESIGRRRQAKTPKGWAPA